MKESRAKLADKYIRQLKEKQRNRLCKKGGAHIVSTAFLYLENHSLGEWFKKGYCR